MRVVESPALWSGASSFTTEASPSGCQWAGVAIGPESDEGLVRVNGVLLQAGRVLPLRASSYAVERVLGVPGGVAALDAVARLQLVLFEHVSELGANVARANGRHEASAVSIAGAGFVRALRFPFVGRRAARCVVVAAAAPASGAHKYQVTGRVYSPLRRVVSEVLLVAETAFQSTDGKVAGFYVGGTNEGECWHELTIDVKSGDGVTVACSSTVETLDEGR